MIKKKLPAHYITENMKNKVKQFITKKQHKTNSLRIKYLKGIFLTYSINSKKNTEHQII